jgi:hypothetical protein
MPKKIIVGWFCGTVLEFVWKDSSICSNCIEIFFIPVSPFRVSSVLCVVCFCLSASLSLLCNWCAGS